MSDSKQFIPAYTIKTKKMRPLGFDILNLDGSGGREYDSSLSHRHTFFELMLFTGGAGEHEIDFKKYPVRKNSAHFVSPGQIHKLTLNHTTGYVVCFTEDLLTLKKGEDVSEKFPFYSAEADPVVTVSESLKQELEMMIRSVIAEMTRFPGNTDLFRSYLNIILFKLKHEYVGEASQAGIEQPKNKTVIMFRKLINEHFLEHLQLTEYAAMLNVTSNHLNALCKKHEGRTAINLIQDRLLLEAKRLFSATGMTVKEVAYSLEFEDVAYFNRFFKKHTGLNPTSYRQQAANNR